MRIVLVRSVRECEDITAEVIRASVFSREEVTRPSVMTLSAERFTHNARELTSD
jgi:hypothetical protein